MLDLAIYHLLVYAFHIMAGVSNIFSSLAGISFVFATSGRFVFKQRGFSWGKYAIWIIYQLLSIAFFSWSVHAMTDILHFQASVSKLLTLPLSFSSNYVFMALLHVFPGLHMRLINRFKKCRTCAL